MQDVGTGVAMFSGESCSSSKGSCTYFSVPNVLPGFWLSSLLLTGSVVHPCKISANDTRT